MSQRDLDLFAEYLRKQRDRHREQAHRIASGSINQNDYQAIVNEAKAAEVFQRMLVDLKLLDQDAGEFVKKFIS